MEKNFTAALNKTLQWEGGYSNDPHDPGGETNLGITQRELNRAHALPGLPQSVRDLTREQAATIYHADYWLPSHAPAKPSGVDAVVFDIAVNNGLGALHAIQQEAAATLPANASAIDQIHTLCDLRSARYHAIAHHNPNLQRYLLGWLNRCADVRYFALSLAAHS